MGWLRKLNQGVVSIVVFTPREIARFLAVAQRSSFPAF
jgi:hypothetical protein